ncbi:helix-turn-helix domain-containing protein [Streptomyces sp. YIM 98790]|uniref:helix-turn-helix domain-containing protein n=1 Tax=Streptomyces sp. YIM 98790 TaxID=2689077 RepID=UPI00140C04AC|nr:helix-turn-helix domain-containing protein [Streptomyces sp. YIM 98790]
MSHGNSPPSDRPSVGRTLQQARVAAKLTVEEVSATTRVRVPIIQSIEQDDFSRCGGDVYARGHIRTLARAVGIDPAELIEQFNAERGTAPVTVPTAPVFEAERIRPEPRRPNWTAAMMAAIVAVVGFVAFTVFSGDDKDTGTVAEDAGGGPQAEESPGPDPDKQSGNPGSDPKQDPEPTPTDSAVAGVPADKVTVKVQASGRSWISVKDQNGQQLFEGELNDGDSETFTADEQIDLVTGNAGAIELYVNGKHIKDVGGPGEVQRLSFTKGDPEEG